jgi:hypothetical protein
MSGTCSDPSGNNSHVCMQIRCPKCGTEMLLHVGLTPDTSNNSISCITCQNKLIPLIPGPIVSGPFAVSD